MSGGQQREASVIMINGAGPGLGKSTLARALAADLAARGLSVELFVEGDILRRAEFLGVIQEFRTRPRVELGTLLAATRAYFDSCLRRGHDVYVLDGLIPYWLSLAAWAYADTEVARFLSDIANLAGELELVEIYLEGDLEAGIERAAAREGGGWIEGQIAKVSGFQQLAAPPRNAKALAVYYGEVAEWVGGFRESVLWPVRVCNAG
ncbi:MAG: hypothetical protein J2P45_31695 [Candidatus Dormibacteraeota bacterium]|nr:hypothetical protein [Candidatus Dormibacteraeota bacterium]